MKISLSKNEIWIMISVLLFIAKLLWEVNVKFLTVALITRLENLLEPKINVHKSEYTSSYSNSLCLMLTYACHKNWQTKLIQCLLYLYIK